MNTDSPEDLNYDCNYNMFLAKALLDKLPAVKDRQKAVKWMRKLLTCNQSVAEMKLRNEFMYFLVLNIQGKALKLPFTEDPPNKSLAEIAHLLPRGGEAGADVEASAAWAGKDSGTGQQPFLYSSSPDGGAFLAAQPVPRCGAFCYLAVVSRTKN